MISDTVTSRSRYGPPLVPRGVGRFEGSSAMRFTSFLAVSLVASSCLLALGACDDDASTTPTKSGDDGGPSSTTPEGGSTGTDDSGSPTTPGTDGGTEAGAEAGAPTTPVPDGKYVIGQWTCGAIDLKAYAATIGIQSIEEVITATTGSIAVVYGPTCSRTSAITAVEYPTNTSIKTTTAGTYTCTVTCLPAQCTSGVQAVQVDTFEAAVNGNKYMYTRTLTAADLANPTFQKLAGCQAGDVETAVYTKQ